MQKDISNANINVGSVVHGAAGVSLQSISTPTLYHTVGHTEWFWSVCSSIKRFTVLRKTRLTRLGDVLKTPYTLPA